MGSSKLPGPQSLSASPQPDVPLRARMSADTPGPLGINDWADPDILARMRATSERIRERALALGQRFAVPAQKANVKVREKHAQRGLDTPPTPEAASAYQGALRFTVGVTPRPKLQHDHGFLDDGKGGVDRSRMRVPTTSDQLERLQWIATLEAAELLRPDLVDGTTAYRHFLFGDGQQRKIDYNRFVIYDSSGKRVWTSVLEDVRAASIGWHDRQRTHSTPVQVTEQFSMSSAIAQVEEDNLRYPYPATENWQKAIGAHVVWVSRADVTVVIDPARAERRFKTKFTLEMEDMYNFNPGMADMATGIPDNTNGRFELTGLGKEYLTVASLERTIEFAAPIDAVNNPRTASSSISAGRTPTTRLPKDAR
jgi:hypothetical protein